MQARYLSKETENTIAKCLLGVRFNTFEDYRKQLDDGIKPENIRDIQDIVELFGFFNNEFPKQNHELKRRTAEMYFDLLTSPFFDTETPIDPTEETTERDIWNSKIDDLRTALENNASFKAYENKRCGLLTRQSDNTLLVQGISVPAKDIQKLTYVASGAFGDTYRAQYTGTDETIQQLCKQIGGNYYFIIKYTKENSNSFAKEQTVATNLFELTKNHTQTHINQSVAAKVITSDGHLDVIISPLQHQKISRKSQAIVSRNFAKFISVKTTENNSNGTKKLAQNQGLLYAGILDNVYKGLQTLHALGYVHLDLAARNVLMTETDYSIDDGKPTTYHGEICDFGYAQKLDQNGEAFDSTQLIPLILCSANRLKGGTLTIDEDLYAYRLLFLETIALSTGHTLRDLFPKSESISDQGIAQWIIRTNDNITVLLNLYERALAMTLSPTLNEELITLLQQFKDYICNPQKNSALDSELFQQCLKQYLATIEKTEGLNELSKRRIEALKSTQTNQGTSPDLAILKYAASQDQLNELTEKLDSIKKRIKTDASLVDIKEIKLILNKYQSLNNNVAYPEQNAILQGYISNNLKLIDNTLPKVESTDRVGKEIIHTFFIKRLIKIDIINKAVARLENNGCGDRIKIHRKNRIYHAHYTTLNDLIAKNPKCKKLYNIFESVKKQPHSRIPTGDYLEAVDHFVKTLNNDLENANNQWKNMVKKPSAELIEAYDRLTSLDMKATPNAAMIIEYALQDEKHFVHEKIFKHLDKLENLGRKLHEKNTFFDRHPYIKIALLGAVWGASVALLFTFAVAFVALNIPTFGAPAAGLAAIFAGIGASVVSGLGFSTAGMSTLGLTGIGLATFGTTATAACATLFSAVATATVKFTNWILKITRKKDAGDTPATFPATGGNTANIGLGLNPNNPASVFTANPTPGYGQLSGASYQNVGEQPDNVSDVPDTDSDVEERNIDQNNERTIPPLMMN